MAPNRDPAPERLSKERDKPLYLQLYAILRAKVQSGELRPGDLVPAESELMRTYGVSRITVRSALEVLVNEGVVERHRGRGSFVRAPETRSCLTSFTDQMLGLGRVPRTEVVSLRVAPAGRLEPGRLPFAADEEVALIERLRRVDGREAAVVRSYIPHRLVPGIRADVFEPTGRGQSLLYVLEHTFGILLDKGEETIVPTCITAPYAGLLGIDEGAAVVLKICLVRDVDGGPVLFEEAFWSAPQTQLVQRLSPPG